MPSKIGFFRDAWRADQLDLGGFFDSIHITSNHMAVWT